MRWIRRKEHTRHLSSGRVVEVRANWAAYDDASDSKKGRRYPQRCQDCGAKIASVPMPNGGWAHYEVGSGMRRIKHPCFHRGEGLSRKRDNLTRDLFDDDSDSSAQNVKKREPQ